MNGRLRFISKLALVIILIALPIIGFYVGYRYGNNVTIARESAPSINGYYSNTAEWQTDSNAGIFSIAYPIDFQVNDNYLASESNDWRLNAGGTTGVRYITLTIPKAFEPQTNFSDATLTVGASGDKTAVEQCMTPDPTNPTAATSTDVLIDGVEFKVFHSDDAGAGNYYETTSYRAVYGGKCYAIEYTIHSNQIMNYPASYNLKPFNESQATSVLDNIVGTFRFMR